MKLTAVDIRFSLICYTIYAIRKFHLYYWRSCRSRSRAGQASAVHWEQSISRMKRYSWSCVYGRIWTKAGLVEKTGLVAQLECLYITRSIVLA